METCFITVVSRQLAEASDIIILVICTQEENAHQEAAVCKYNKQKDKKAEFVGDDGGRP